jgi:hypothetical protein
MVVKFVPTDRFLTLGVKLVLIASIQLVMLHLRGRPGLPSVSTVDPGFMPIKSPISVESVILALTVLVALTNVKYVLQVQIMKLGPPAAHHAHLEQSKSEPFAKNAKWENTQNLVQLPVLRVTAEGNILTRMGLASARQLLLE